MNRMTRTTFVWVIAAGTLSFGASSKVAAADDPAPPAGINFVIDVAMDGRTWRMNDGTNPFFPIFTGALARGNTFIVSGRDLSSPHSCGGRDFRRAGQSARAGTARPNRDVGVPRHVQPGYRRHCRRCYPHVTSTQVFTFNTGDIIVTEGAEGGAPVLRSVIGGAGRYRHVSGQVVERPLGVNTTNLFNVRFRFRLAARHAE